MELACQFMIIAEDILAQYFAVHAGNKSIFLADLRAAKYVLSGTPTDGLSIAAFNKYHQQVSQDITGVSVSLISLASEEELTKIIAGWILLYRAALQDLRERHPANCLSDLEFQGVNWSAQLGISASGLVHLDQTSRYAEYWAQNSITDKKIQNSLDKRLKFIGSPVYLQLARIKECGDLLVYNNDNLGTSTYDIAELMRRRPQGITARNWTMQAGCRPTIMSGPAEEFLEGLAADAQVEHEKIYIRFIPARRALNYIELNSKFNPLARHSARSSPETPALIAVDRMGKICGCVVNGMPSNDKFPPSRHLLGSHPAALWALLDELRSYTSFQRLTFEPNALEFVRCVFPNQPSRFLRIYHYQEARDVSPVLKMQLLINDQTVAINLKSSNVLDLPNVPSMKLLICDEDGSELVVQLAPPYMAATRIPAGLKDSDLRSLLAAAGQVAAVNRLALYVSVDDRISKAGELLTREGFSPLPSLLCLDEWYFTGNARSIRRCDFSRHVDAPKAVPKLQDSSFIQ